jgi:hypothetical protein
MALTCYYCGGAISIIEAIEPCDDEDLSEGYEDTEGLFFLSVGMQCVCECGFSGPICEDADDACEAHMIMSKLVQKECDKLGIEESK